ncbi:First C2 domain [Trypanosoma vivax]|uniref:RPGR-interacting protein 1 first C2 domain-containing protein n=1 Tax=Trypanosoma vivax (strain Y486) TaxID=1055687 RepID=G0U0Q5_TRYVY|nr:hypothetical protein TRVL_00017 [Trypanosoma vivax]KAH8609031.1 First C2 domain [Trypanosoma vivax]CCC49654.1 conserved hypothetical protein [Trypanosoma vivax Y486]
MLPRVNTNRTADEWREAFFQLEERQRQLQQQLNERDKELKLLKVSQRRSAAAARHLPGFRAGGSRLVSSAAADDVGKREAPIVTEAATATSPPPPPPPPSAPLPRRMKETAPERNVEFVPVPSVARKQDTTLEALGVSAVAPPPDPSMVWGMENSIQNYMTANALYHANEELRQRLEDCAALVKTLQQELASSRAVTKATQTRLEETVQQVHQLSRERDIACQKLSVVQHTVSEHERQEQQRVAEEERIRFSFESQIADLRSRLVAGADSNEILSRDVRTLLSEVKEKSSTVLTLSSKLSLAEAALASQKQTNENLLVELKSLNCQLINERKRLLAATREVQLANMRADEARDTEARLSAAVQSRTALEREHVKLMESLVHVTEGALVQARAEVQQDLHESRAAAAHWEEVSKLLYKDISQRTRAHIQCREECEEAKSERDRTAVALRTVTAELQMCRVKLDIVWPTHSVDTRDLTPAELIAMFSNRKAVFKHMGRRDAAGRGTVASAGSGVDEGAASMYDVEIATELEDTALSEQVHELREANRLLVAELERLQLANDLQAERLGTLEKHLHREQEAAQASVKEVQEREAATQEFLQCQLDRVSFLEAQVRSLRGYEVPPSKSLSDISEGETVFDLFLGQLLSTETPQGIGIRNTFPPVFCSVDFLLHETVTTSVVTGLNAFLDTTVSFCVAMDALLLWYLQSRELLVQLHHVHSMEEAGSADSDGENRNNISFAERLYTTLAEGSVSLYALASDPKYRDAQRPTLRGHIPLVDSNGHHVASVEFVVTVRAPFSEAFRALAAASAEERNRVQHLSVEQGDDAGQGSALVPHDRAGEECSVKRRQPGGSVEVGAPAEGRTPAVGTETPTNKVASSRERRMQLVHTPARPDVGEGVSTTSSSISGVGQSPNFTLVPRAAAIANMLAPSAVRTLVVDVSKLWLPHNLSRLPLLSCYYVLKPLGRHMYLPPPPAPRYEYEYLQEGGTSGTLFQVRTTKELLDVTREPFILFFLDETPHVMGGFAVKESSTRPYWAMAMTEWRLALENPGEYVTLMLPLIDQRGTHIEGARVRVRLLATGLSANEIKTAPSHEAVAALSETYRSQPACAVEGMDRQPYGNALVSDQRASAHGEVVEAQGAGVGSDVANSAHGAQREVPVDDIDMEMIRRQLGF